MSFKVAKCKIPTIYCGASKKIPSLKESTSIDSYYYKKGTATECVKKGYAAGMINEKLKNLPKNSIQQIKYVGEIYEKRFAIKKIKTTTQLINYVKKNNKTSIDKLLKNVYKKSNGTFDSRAYNSTLIFLYTNGYNNLPTCKKISP